MPEMLDRIRRELDDRIAMLRPAATEFEHLQRALKALDEIPLGAAAPVAPSGARRRAKAPATRPPTGRAAPGQTQQRVIEELRRGPGSSSTAVAAALGISANAAAATISRLVKQGRVHRLDGGGYAAGEAPPPSAG